MASIAIKNFDKKTDKVKCEYERICSTCEKAFPIEDAGYMLCSKKGLVIADGYCRKFTYDLLKRNPVRSPQVIKLSKEALDISDL